MVRRPWRRRLRRLGRRLRYGRHSGPARRYVLWGAAALFGLTVVWLLVTGLLAKQQLSRLEQRIEVVRTLVAQGRLTEAQALARDIPAMAHRAHHLTTGPAWWFAAQVPFLGDPLDVTRGTTTAVDQLGGEAIPQLMQVANLVDPNQLRASGDTIKVAPLVSAAPALAHADAAISAAADQLRGLDSSTWLSAVDTRRARLLDQVSRLQGYIDAAARVTRVLPGLLGRSTPTRYFIGLQNEAEMRGTGGLPGAFAIAVVSDGTIRFTHFESDAVFARRVDTGLDFGSEYNALYGPSEPTTTFADSNVSPQFPYAAQIWAAMWQKVSGEHVDAVIGLDPTALGYFLAATGPTTLPSGGQLNAANVVSLTQRDNYAIYPDNAQRKAFLVAVLRAAAHKVTSGAGAPLDLVRAASRAGSERRMIAWSRDPAIEQALEQTDYASTLPPPSRPLSAPIVVNAAAGKLDYYLARTLTYARTGCGARRDVLATITLQNDAPASGLPGYVTTRLDHPPAGAKPGDNHVLLDYYASADARLLSVTLNGAPSTASASTELGHAVFRLDLELPRGTTQTIVLHLDEPAGQGDPVIWRQPGVTPLVVEEQNQSC